MTEAQKIALRISEVRQELNELSGVETPTDDQVTKIDELSNEYKKLEVRARAAIIADDKANENGAESETTETDTNDDKLAELETRSSVADVFVAATGGRDPDGATRELQTELGLDGNQIPLALLRDRETRAVTPAPSDVGQSQQGIIPGVFPQSVAAFLGVDMPSVPVGEAVFPVLTTNATVGTPAEGAAQAETTGSFSSDVLSPARLQASFFYSREDRARFAGMDAALRQNLSDALSDALDKQVVSGTNGLLTSTNLAANAASAVTSYALYRSGLVYDRIDGIYASMASDIRIVMGSATYGHAAGQYRGNAAPDNALDVLMRDSSGVRVSAHVPAVASNKQNAIVRRGMRRDMVAALWEGVTLIPDEVTKASTGEIVITAVLLYAVKILRAAGFAKVESQHA